jgi:hypothetical protein
MCLWKQPRTIRNTQIHFVDIRATYPAHLILLDLTTLIILGEGMLMGYWCENQKKKDHWEDQDVDGWAISQWILER